MSSTVAVQQNRGVRVVGLLSIIAGIILIIAGGITWWAVADQLSAEEITVSEDASFLAGRHVNDPFSAYAQAEVINKHALETSDGMTYAQLPQDDPRREVVMNASFLRASLFTSVVSFGVAALVVGLGVLFILVGWALRRLASAGPRVAAATAGTAGAPGAHSYDDVPSAPAPRHQSPPAASTQTPGTTRGAAPGASAAAATPAAAHAATHAAPATTHPDRPATHAERSASQADDPTPPAAPITNPGPEPTTPVAPTPVAPTQDPAVTPAPGTTPGVTPTTAPTTPTTEPTITPTPATTPDGVPDGVPQENPGNPPQTPGTGTGTDERPSGWASPADRVPPVDGTPGENGTR